MIAPPHRLPRTAVLDLGARVSWTHRAAVARWVTAEAALVRPGRGAWRLTEGLARGEPYPPIGVPEEEEAIYRFTEDAPFYERRRGSANKTVIVWPEEGEGVLIGLVRRGLGESSPSSGGGSMFEDFEPGFFTAAAFLHLYAVKQTLTGTSYLLCPWWAVTEPPGAAVTSGRHREPSRGASARRRRQDASERIPASRGAVWARAL